MGLVVKCLSVMPNTEERLAIGSSLESQQFVFAPGTVPVFSAGDSDQIVLHSHGPALTTPTLRVRVAAALQRVRTLPHVTGVVSPYVTPHAISGDGKTGFATLTFDERGDALPQDAVKSVVREAEQPLFFCKRG